MKLDIYQYDVELLDNVDLSTFTAPFNAAFYLSGQTDPAQSGGYTGTTGTALVVDEDQPPSSHYVLAIGESVHTIADVSATAAPTVSLCAPEAPGNKRVDVVATSPTVVQLQTIVEGIAAELAAVKAALGS